MPKPVCLPCGRFFRPTHNGIYFTEGMPKFNGAKPGKEHADDWQPYKVWVGDEWTCKGCGAKIVVGFGNTRIKEHYEPDFEEVQKATNADKNWVYDC